MSLPTWRVVNSAGELVPVRVWVGYCDCGCKQSPTWVQVDDGTSYGVNRDGEAPQRDIRRKIGEAYPCAEIRAPGEMTTAERLAAVEAERDRYREAAQTSDSDAEREAIRWADRVVALEAENERLRAVAEAARAYVEGGEFSCDDVRTESREALTDALDALAGGAP